MQLREFNRYKPALRLMIQRLLLLHQGNSVDHREAFIRLLQTVSRYVSIKMTNVLTGY